MISIKIAILALFLLCNNLFAKEFTVCKEYFFIKENQTYKKQLLIEEILNNNPTNIECMLKLSSLYLRNNKVSQGFDLIRKAYEIDPKFVEAKNISKILDTALKLSKLKEDARKKSNLKLWNELGDIYFEMGIFDEAREAYTISLLLDATQTKIEILLAICYKNLNQNLKSAKRLKNIVQKEPYNFYANYYLGKLLKNVLKHKKEGEKYLLMAEYIINYTKPKFEDEAEFLYLKNDLEFELGKK